MKFVLRKYIIIIFFFKYLKIPSFSVTLICMFVAVHSASVPPNFNLACPRPNCYDVQQFMRLHPVAQDPTKFYRCVHMGDILVPMMLPCECMTFFSNDNQKCEFPTAISNFCKDTPNPLPEPRPCNWLKQIKGWENLANTIKIKFDKELLQLTV